MIISKRFNFDAAHYLPGYPGKCKDMHGHRWTVEVACDGVVHLKTGMVVDFAELKKFCRGIEDLFDHTILNDFEYITIPTAENICTYIYKEFEYWCANNGVNAKYARVWETPDSMVEHRSE